MSSIRYMQLRRYTIVTLKYFLTTALGFYLAGIIAPGEMLSITFIAVLSLQPNLYRGLKFSWTQLTATTLATLITTLFIVGFQLDLQARPTLLTSSLAMGATILFCLRLGLEEGTVVALFTVAYLSSIPLMTDTSFVHGVFLRYLTIVIGVGNAALFNFLSSLFRYRDRLFLHLVDSGGQLDEHLSKFKNFLGDYQGVTETRPPLKKLLNEFGPIFSSIRNLRQDLDEIDREVGIFKRAGVAREKQVYRSLLNTFNDISHYSWDILLNLLNYDVRPEVLELVDDHFGRFQQDFSALLGRFEKMQARGGDVRTGINRRVEELNQKIDESVPENPESSAPRMAIFSDLIHINLNLLQFEKYLGELVEARAEDDE